jgi:hypothetical protein
MCVYQNWDTYKTDEVKIEGKIFTSDKRDKNTCLYRKAGEKETSNTLSLANLPVSQTMNAEKQKRQTRSMNGKNYLNAFELMAWPLCWRKPTSRMIYLR